jgi:pyrimidine-nucleoside phosphorylase
MSKKLAAGASAIVLDVKCGRGAFMRSREDAVRLARLLASIGRAHGRRVAVAVTPMDQPLGNAVGHSLEVKEAVEMLRGSGPADLREVSLAIAARMAALSGAAPTEQSARASVEAALRDGTGLAKLRAMVKAQGGDPRVVDEPQRLPKADCVDVLRAPGSGHVRSIDALRVGLAVEVLGGSRRGSHEVIDRAVGIVLRRREGDEVAGGDVLAEIHASSRASLADALPVLTGAIRMGDKPSSVAQALEVEWVE